MAEYGNNREKERRPSAKIDKKEQRSKEKEHSKDGKRKHSKKNHTKGQAGSGTSRGQEGSGSSRYSSDKSKSSRASCTDRSFGLTDSTSSDFSQADSPTKKTGARKKKEAGCHLKVTSDEEDLQREFRRAKKESNKVKVCGSTNFQDQFVYFATKKLKSRTRNLDKKPHSDFQVIPSGAVLPGDVDFMQKLWTDESNQPLSSTNTKPAPLLLPNTLTKSESASLPSELSDFVSSYSLNLTEPGPQTPIPHDMATVEIPSATTPPDDTMMSQVTSPDASFMESPLKGLHNLPKQDMDELVQSLTTDDVQQLIQAVNSEPISDPETLNALTELSGLVKMSENLDESALSTESSTQRNAYSIYDDAASSEAADSLSNVTENSFLSAIPDIVVTAPSECGSVSDVHSPVVPPDLPGALGPMSLSQTTANQTRPDQKKTDNVVEPRATDLIGEVTKTTEPVVGNLDPGQGFINQPEASTLFDLEDVDSSNLLSSTVPNINMIFNDLSSSPLKSINLSSSGIDRSKMAAIANLTPSMMTGSENDNSVKLEPSLLNREPVFGGHNKELLRHLNTDPLVVSETGSSAPELTAVHMFWNTFPGLMINNVQYVRLVDIHKQALPAKDTGLLKKRCQCMGLPIRTCTDMQRDFLQRYAKAAASKSTVIVSKETAEILLDYYVNPPPKGAKPHSESDSASNPVEVADVNMTNRVPEPVRQIPALSTLEELVRRGSKVKEVVTVEETKDKKPVPAWVLEMERKKKKVPTATLR